MAELLRGNMAPKALSDVAQRIRGLLLEARYLGLLEEPASKRGPIGPNMIRFRTIGELARGKVVGHH